MTNSNISAQHPDAVLIRPASAFITTRTIYLTVLCVFLAAFATTATAAPVALSDSTGTYPVSYTLAQFIGTDEERRKDRYQVVINHEEQYSIWLSDRDPPRGWKGIGRTGTKQECMDYIEEVWTDMRPLSLEKQLEALERNEREQGRRK